MHTYIKQQQNIQQVINVKSVKENSKRKSGRIAATQFASGKNCMKHRIQAANSSVMQMIRHIRAQFTFYGKCDFPLATDHTRSWCKLKHIYVYICINEFL